MNLSRSLRESTLSLQKGELLMDFEHCISQLFQFSDFFQFLDKHSAHSLSLTSQKISTPLRNLISHFWIFFLEIDQDRQFRMYTPKNITLSIFFSQLPKEKYHYFDCVKKINFYSNHKINRIIPFFPNLNEIYFAHIFLQPVNHLPSSPSLTHITFGDNFNQQVDHLPPSLTHLSFGFFFNEPIDHLPPALTHLILGNTFCRKVDHLPPTITHLSFGKEFNQSINNLPSSISHLSLGKSFNQELTLPPNLKELIYPVYKPTFHSIPPHIVVKRYAER